MKILFFLFNLSTLLLISLPLRSEQILSKFKQVALYELPGKFDYYKGYTYYNDCLYSLVISETGKELFLRNHNKNENTKIDFPFGEYLSKPRFILTNDTLILAAVNQLHVYKKSVTGYKLLKIYSSSGNCSKLRLIDNKIYALSIAFSAGINVNYKEKSVVDCWVYDLKDTNGKLLNLPEPEGWGYSFTTHNMTLDVTNDNIYLADYSNYRILIYDWQMNVVDSIVYKPKDWVDNGEKVPVYNKDPQYVVNFIQKIDSYKAKLSQIHSINLLDEDKLLVCWSVPTETKQIPRFDIWDLKSKTLVYNDLTDFETDSNSLLTPENMEITREVRFENGYWFVKQFGSRIFLYDKYLNKNYNEYIKECDTYFEDNDLWSLVSIYRFK